MLIHFSEPFLNQSVDSFPMGFVGSVDFFYIFVMVDRLKITNCILYYNDLCLYFFDSDLDILDVLSINKMAKSLREIKPKSNMASEENVTVVYKLIFRYLL